MVTIIKKGTPREEIRDILERHAKKRRKKIDLLKYCGILRLKEDPMELQKNWRNEWE
ncbi:MAG: hypothetical protein AB9834_13760 [Lentimicrobium sp.]